MTKGTTTWRAGGTVGAAVRIPDIWLCGNTHMTMKRTGCSYREALVIALQTWQEQERLEAQYMAERN